MGKSAVFFVYVWPEPKSSAAGVRTRALMQALLRAGWAVAAVSPSGESPYREQLRALGVGTHTCDPNTSSATDAVLASLAPDLVIYDRFVMEEQFGWRARTAWPAAAHVTDTQDLHSVRRAREASVLRGEALAPLLPESMGDDLLRELSSLHRSDAALVVSSWEKNFLETSCAFPPRKLLHLPFPAQEEARAASFGERRGFCFLGNFRHAPNLDSVRFLVNELWPKVRASIPGAELHLYGAYPPSEISRHKGAQGVFAHGPVDDHRAALLSHRALLAPLRFGAGIKGKVLEAWSCGTPVIGTNLTFEGMCGNSVEISTPDEFVAACRALHSEEPLWARESETARALVRAHYAEAPLAARFLAFVERLSAEHLAHRNTDLTGAMLRHQSNLSSKYFSRWIEAKNARTPASP